MPESTTEQLSNREKPSPTQIFELLYPGNKFSQLRSFDPRNIGNMFDEFMNPIGVFTRFNQELRLMEALELGKQYAGRITMGYPDKSYISHQFKGFVPIEGGTHGTSFQENLFTDLLRSEKGEYLGGVATKRISRNVTTAERITARILGDKFYDADVYFIGILDENHKPSGLIVFYEGKDGIKRKVKETETHSVPNPNLELNPTIA